MSLIRVRRNRKKEWIDIKRGRSTRALVFLLILCAMAFWYLATRF